MSTIEKLLQTCITEPDALARNWNLTEEEIRQLRAITDVYPIRIPKYYLDLIGPDWKSDPIRKLCFPDLMEISTSGQKDTSGEARNTKMTGLQHKYAQTALILTTNQCAMYCRHCFRKRMVGSDAREVALHMDGMKAYVEQHKEIDNVLLSGGDALMLENAVMRQYLEAFSSIKHLHFIRIGTRIPVALPDRILQDPELIDLLKTYNRKKQLIIVTHYNHSKEITEKSRQAVKILLEAGIPVRNQTVLLQGINDDPKTLSSLLNQLTSIGVMPYYIFQCRPAMGVMKQFQVPLRKGSHIVEQARAQMNGQAKACRYVLSHESGKIEILGEWNQEEMLFKYHQSKYSKDANRIFAQRIKPDQCWLNHTDDIDA